MNAPLKRLLLSYEFHQMITNYYYNVEKMRSFLEARKDVKLVRSMAVNSQFSVSISYTAGLSDSSIGKSDTSLSLLLPSPFPNHAASPAGLVFS